MLHIGDHDPSGVHVFSSLAEDVRALITDQGYLAALTFTRLAVTPEQIAAFDLPSAPPKLTHRRRFEGDKTVQGRGHRAARAR
jgi:hypothetical protein